jgi:outer membrane lipoprotein carrier protein
MYKKLFTSFIVFALGTVSLFAQAPKGMGSNDPEAKRILDAVSSKFKSYKSVQGKFNLKIENAANKVIGTKSGMVYMKGTKYKISITGQEIFCDGSTIWTYDKSANEVTINKLEANNNTITPQKLFTNFYDKDFLYKLNGETKGTQEIELTPIDKSKPFFKVLVGINKAAQSISSTKVFEKTGNKYTYVINNMNTSATVADAQFVFDAKKYAGVEVVDLR